MSTKPPSIRPSALQSQSHSKAEACCLPSTPSPEVVADALADAAADAELAAFAKAIGHPVRVRILRMLAEREAKTCSLIVDELPLAQSTVSEHLRILKAAGLVRSREDGPRTWYCIEMPAWRRLKTLLKSI